MKKLVRKCVWETNSSSSHSVSVAGSDKEFILDTIYPDQNGAVHVFGGEFGWEWERYNDAETKLSYAYQDNVSKKLLADVINKQTGAKKVIFDKTSKENGYIDHESVGTASSICTDEESTRNFIFNKNSWLFTGNDNGEPDPTFYDVPEYKNGMVINPVYKYELSIEGLGKTTKFVEYPDSEKLEQGIAAITRDILMNDNGDMITENSIYFQITRPRNFFEISWNIDQDYSKGYIIMTREGPAIYEVEKRLETEGKFTGLTRKEKSQVLCEEILKSDFLARKVPFKITEI